MIFLYFLAASAAKNCEKKAVIQSAASAASAKGGCASSRLDHGLKFYVTRGGCASSRLIQRVNQGSEWSIKGQSGQSRVRMVNLESDSRLTILTLD